MIPVGNWEETNDELRSNIADLEEELDELQLTNEYLTDENSELQSALNAADTDIADYLFELDHLREENGELKQDMEGLLLLVEYWQEKALTAEDRAHDLETQLEDRRNRVAALKADRISLRSQVEELEKENADMFSENNRILAELRNAEQEIETLQREKRHDALTYLTIDGQSMENYVRVNELTKELTELKAALRTLGGEGEN